MLRIEKIIEKLSQGYKTNQELVIDGQILGRNAIVEILSRVQNLDIKRISFDNMNDNCFNDWEVDMSYIADFIERGGPSIVSFIEIDNRSLITILERLTSYATSISTQLAKAFSRGLSTLSFSCQQFSAREANALALFIKRGHLDNLHFYSCEFEAGALAIIMRTVRTSSLKGLNLDSVGITGADIAIVATCLQRGKLTKLSMRDSLYPYNLNPIAKAIIASSIRKLDLRLNHSEIMDKKLISFVKAVHIEKLCINIVDEVHTPELINAITNNVAIKSISFDVRTCTSSASSEINGATLRALCVLLEMPGLIYLKLKWTGIVEAQTVSIVQSLRRSSIARLNLIFQKCPLNREQIESICDLVKERRLRKLELSNVGLTDELAQLILPHVRTSLLTKFIVENNHDLSSGMQECIKEQLKQNKLRLQ